MTKLISIEAIEKQAGKSWNEWVKFLDGDGSFTVSVNKTFGGTMDQALEAWERLVASIRFLTNPLSKTSYLT